LLYALRGGAGRRRPPSIVVIPPTRPEHDVGPRAAIWRRLAPGPPAAAVLRAAAGVPRPRCLRRVHPDAGPSGRGTAWFSGPSADPAGPAPRAGLRVL